MSLILMRMKSSSYVHLREGEGMNRRNPKLKQLDRDLNRALKDAHSPAQAFTIKAEFADKRRRVLAGEDLQEPVHNPSVEPVREWILPATAPQSYEIIYRQMGASLLGAAQDFARAMNGNGRQWTFAVGTWEEPKETPERKAAKVRAEGFLLEHLDEAQTQTYRQSHYFIVTNKVSKRRWKIRTNATAYNVDLIDGDGKKIATFCGVPSGSWVPPCDIYLAQKLILETDEAEFLIKANRQSMASYTIGVDCARA